MLALAVVLAVAAAVRGLWSPCGLSMLSSLNPMSERARGHRFGLTATWYVLGGALGGLALGGVCALAAGGLHAAHLSRTVAFAAAAAAAVIGAWSDSPLGRSLPDHPRQVDETWMGRYRRWIYAAGYGVQIGTGFATYIMTAAVYGTAVLAVLAGPRDAVIIGLTFGLVRGLAILVTVRATDPDRLRGLLRRVDLAAPASVAVLIAVQAAVASAAAAVAGGPIVAAAVLVVAGVPLLARRRDVAVAS
jgi:MFS family permease